MSVRTNPMKAVPVLLKRVKCTRTILDQRGSDDSLGGKLDQLTRELNKIEHVFMKVKKNQDQLLDTLHEVDGHLRKLDTKRLHQDMDHFCGRIRDCAHKLLPVDDFDEDDNTQTVQLSDDPSSSQHKEELVLYKDAQDVDWDPILRLEEHPLTYCLATLATFPIDAIINKWHTIYLWIGAGLLQSSSEKTVEEDAEDIIDQLLKLKYIVPYGNGKCPIVNKFKVNPHIQRELLKQRCMSRTDLHHLGYYLPTRQPRSIWLVLTQQKVTLADGLKLDGSTRAVLNVGARYLNFGSQWLDKSIQLKVLQLGRWQDSPSHHIEVGSLEFLKNLRNQKELRYLSLRGISRISELPHSIAQLESLEILDLKACHNLETLPDDISSLKSLTHLILSQCHLLDGMPKGIEKLTKLQVLKGFLIGSPMTTPCRISDLANLKNLRRLSIRIGSGAVIEDGEFEAFEELAALEHLKISWGVSRYSHIPVILPSSLIKLHLECFPGQRITDWVSSERIKELNITGGKLESLNFDPASNLGLVTFVRLKYLRHLQVDIQNLEELFPLLSYAEMKKVGNVSYFEWRRK